MKLSKSKYCSAVQCKKILWLDKNMPEVRVDVASSSVLDNGTDVGILAQELFQNRVDIKFDSNLNNMIEDTKKALENENIAISEASFEYNDNFCSVDILKKIGNTYEIYEVKSSTDVHDIYKEDVSYQYYVLKNLGLNVTKVYLIHINSKYVRGKELELDKLFTIEDLTDIAKLKYDEVEKNIKDINTYMGQMKEPLDDIDVKCTNPYDCPFWNYCTRNLNKPNVFDLKGVGLSSKKKFGLYHEGKIEFKDLLSANIPDKFKEQIDFEINNKEDKITTNNIKEFLKTITYPIYFLDFETFQQPIPMFEGVSPFMQIPFQYSLHYIEYENGPLLHKEFLGDGITDPRRELALQLVADIPKDVCTLAYNMGFEKGRIRELANLFPDLKEHLLNIHDNIVDLMIPFQKRDYYTKSMEGSYSIKWVLPALFPNDPSLDYHNLDMIHNGSEAMNSYASLSTFSKEEQEVIRKNMLEYCKLDTYAMVKIWEKLMEVTNQKVRVKKDKK